MITPLRRRAPAGVALLSCAIAVLVGCSQDRPEFDGKSTSPPGETSDPVPQSTASTAPAVTSTTPAVTSAESDLYDCAEPTVEIITFDWTHPDRDIIGYAPSGVLFELGTMRIRITNHSKHKIVTTGARFDMAWRTGDGELFISSEHVKPGLAWDYVPMRGATDKSTDRVGGHQSIGYEQGFGIVHATDGTEPWANQSIVDWWFENPVIREACDEQFARLGRHTGPPK